MITTNFLFLFLCGNDVCYLFSFACFILLVEHAKNNALTIPLVGDEVLKAEQFLETIIKGDYHLLSIMSHKKKSIMLWGNHDKLVILCEVLN